MDSKRAVTALSSLAQDSRLAVYRLLVQRGPEGYAAGDLAERLDIPGPTLSFHLKALVQADLIVARKASRHIYYSANFSQMDALIAYLTEHCCSLGTACAEACAPARVDKRRKSA